MLGSQDVTGFGLKLFVNTNNRRSTGTANLQNKLSARGVQQKPGGMFHVQLARHDDTAKLFMKILYWIIKGECCVGEVELFER